jgi:hypothetical protein
MSGPGDAYYQVAHLPGGTPVEVHDQTPDGWLAIRPPEGSFSLVSAADIDVVAPGVGQINRAGARSRVGSHLSPRNDAMHVALEQGEQVQVLGADDQRSSWLRIAPPAGEFRWMRASDVSRQPVPLESPDHAAADNEWRSRQGASTTLVSVNQPAPSRYQQSSPPAAVQPADLPTADVPVESLVPRSLPDIAESDAAVDAAGASPLATPVAAEPTSSTPGDAERGSPPADAIERTIDDIEFAIARRVSEPVNVWKLDDIEREVADLLTSDADESQKQTLRQIAARLDRFARIQKGYQSTRQMPATLAPAPPAATNSAGFAPEADDGITPLEPADPKNNGNRFDAIGVLRPVVSKRAGAPPYALVDDEGRIVTFITPSPSLNVQAMLGRKVGVSGTRGFMPEYQQRHVATARIEAMPEVMRR